MKKAGDIADVRSTLNEVAAMLEEMQACLSVLSEKQALWVPSGDDVWPIQRSVTHCVNCEHRAVVELQRAIQGLPTPETIPADTAIFAWHGPTPYALARLVHELKGQIAQLSGMLDSSHLEVEAVRYPKHQPRTLVKYVNVMRGHTEAHLKAIKRKLAAMPPSEERDPEVRRAYPDFGRGHLAAEPRET